MSEIVIEPFHIRDALALGRDVNGASLCQIAGPAFTLRDGKRVLAIGGIRVQGVGQAWTVIDPDAAQHRTKTILRAAHTVLDQAIAHERLYVVYAEATMDKPAFYEHLGFLRQDNLWVRCG